jgi:hypothetical protein
MTEIKSQNAHLGRYRKTVVQLGCLAGVLFALPGCQSVTGSSQLSQVRIINASPDAGGGALDFYLGGSILVNNVGFGYSSAYVPISPGNYNVAVDTAGTKQQLIVAGGTFLTNSQYSVLVGDYAANLQEVILKDQSIAAPSNDISIRIVDSSYKLGSVDVYLVPTGSTLAQSKALLTSLTPTSAPFYLNVPTNTYTLVVMPAGVVPGTGSTTLYTGAAVAYPGGSARTIVILDSTVTTVPSVNAMILNDFDLPAEGN